MATSRIEHKLIYKKEQRKYRLKQTKTDENIIIKQADKGGAIVVMDKAFYKDKVLELLENSKTIPN